MRLLSLQSGESLEVCCDVTWRVKLASRRCFCGTGGNKYNKYKLFDCDPAERCGYLSRLMLMPVRPQGFFSDKNGWF